MLIFVLANWARSELEPGFSAASQYSPLDSGRVAVVLPLGYEMVHFSSLNRAPHFTRSSLEMDIRVKVRSGV